MENAAKKDYDGRMGETIWWLWSAPSPFPKVKP